MQKDKVYKLILSVFLAVFLVGSLISCKKTDTLSLKEAESVDEKKTESEKGEHKSEQDTDKQADRQETEGEADESGSRPAKVGQEDTLSVYICGAVNNTGVYELPAGSRLYQGIEAAGGMRPDADENYLNLAMELSDGEKIQVPTKEETQNGAWEASAENAVSSANNAKAPDNGLVNLNTADEALLKTLTGIGEAKAKSIISYREENGSFSKIDDIMKIPGIKQSVFDKIKDKICV